MIAGTYFLPKFFDPYFEQQPGFCPIWKL